jgi:hypothetical protein
MPSIPESVQAKIRDAAGKRELFVVAQLLCRATALRAGNEVLRAFLVSSTMHSDPLDADYVSLGEVLRESLFAAGDKLSPETSMAVKRAIFRRGDDTGSIADGFASHAWSDATIKKLDDIAKAFGR